MTFKKRWPAFLFITTLSVTLLGCGGDSDGGTGPSDGGTGPGETVLSGIFLDAVVQGLTYQSGDTPPGQTGQVGSFEYVQGEPITFSMGGVVLGTLNSGSTVITPFDFPVPENVARFIQSFDDDLDPSNGITLGGSVGPLSGVSVPSSVFENPDRTSFETDPALVNALQVSGRTLIDATTAMNNLQSGTDNSFSVSELADQVFALSVGLFPFDALGVVLFHALESPGARGSTGEFILNEDHSTETGQDFTWDVSTSGVLTLDLVDDVTVVITRAGGTDRIISGILADPGEQPEPITFFRPLPLTETNIAGAPITQNGTASQTFKLTDSYDHHNVGVPAGFEVTFKADGTFSSVEPNGVVVGTWSVNDFLDDMIVMIPAQAPNDWRLIMLLDGNPAGGGIGGEAFVAEATVTAGTVDDPELTFTRFYFPVSQLTGVFPN